MANVTLSVLRTRARERADMASSSFISDASLNYWINEGGQRVHEMLVEAYGEEYIATSVALSSLTSASSNGGTLYTLPTDFYKLYGIDHTVNGETRSLQPFMRQERNFYRAQSNTSLLMEPAYKLQGNYVLVLPPPTGTGVLYYAPTFTLLSADGDNINFPNGWERLVVLYAAIQCLLKEESDVGPLRYEMEKQEQELANIKIGRDAAMPRHVVDLGSLPDDWCY